MALSEKRTGELFVFSEIVLWSFFPIVATLSYAVLPSLISLGWSAVFATIFLGCVVQYKKAWHEMHSPELWKYMFFITLFIAILFYLFYFVGLQKTTAGNAALIIQFEIFSSFIFFNIFRKEYISIGHIVGSGFMVLGIFVVLVPNFSQINIGDFLIVAATLCSPIGNLYQQKARRIASSESILFLRTLISIPFVFLFAYMFNMHASTQDVWSSLPILIAIGVLILGLQKILWIEAIHRIAVTKAMALGALGPFLTLLLAWLILAQAPTLWQLASAPVFLIGTLLLTDQIRLGNSTEVS